jgi:hypothetical protein
MVFVLVGLGVFMVVRVATEGITAPAWFYMALSIALACGGLALTSESPWWGPAVAGIAFGFYRGDQVIVALRDWIRVRVLRGPSRR